MQNPATLAPILWKGAVRTFIVAAVMEFIRPEVMDTGPPAAVSERAPACPACGRPETKRKVVSFRTNAWSTFLDGMEKRVNPQKFK